MFHILLVLGLVALAAALWLVLRPWRVAAAVPAFAGLVLLHFSYYIEVPLRAFVFWGIATAMVAGLTYLSPSGEPDGNKASNLYVGLSAMASICGRTRSVNSASAAGGIISPPICMRSRKSTR